MAVAERTGAPLRVAVGGRRGVGCSTVARALDLAGSTSGITVTNSRQSVADLQVYVVAEVVKPEDSAALPADGSPVLVVLNKADLTGFGGDGPIAAAGARCDLFAQLLGLAGVEMLPMSALLAVAALEDLDATCAAALGELAAHPGGLSDLDGSFDGFLAAQLPVPVAARRRLLECSTCSASRWGLPPFDKAAFGELRAVLRRISGIDAVIDRLVVVGAQVRYRRVLDAVCELEALAVSQAVAGLGGGQIRAFLSSDDTVVARMAAATEAARPAGWNRDPTATVAAGGALAALPPHGGERSAQCLCGGYRQGIAPVVVAGRRDAASSVPGGTVTAGARDDPAARVDALVAAIGPNVESPAVTRREVVLVTGPWLSGVTSVAAALRERIPQHTFVESLELGPGDAPMAVVFVVSASAPLTESDCALLDAAAENADAVVGAVTKIDVHLTWRDVVRQPGKAGRARTRYLRAPWVGVAAAPDRGDHPSTSWS